MEETLINFGSELKSLGVTAEGKGRIGGYLVRWGSEDETDLSGDYFTKSTYLGAHDGNGADAMIHHGQPLKFKGRVVDELKWTKDVLLPPLKTKRDDIGLFAETICDMSDEWEKKVYELAAKGKFKWSSGAAAHTVRRRDGQKSGEILRWPIVEGSLTPSPCEPRSTRVMSLKSYLEVEPEFEEADELKAVTTTTTAAPYPQQQSGAVSYPSARARFLAGDDSEFDEERDYSRCVACSAHNSPDATKCSECGALIPESGRKSVEDIELDDELKASGAWITINGAHVQIGGALHKKIFGSDDGKNPDAPATDEDVDIAADEHKLDKDGKKKLKERHVSGKAKSRLDIFSEAADLAADNARAARSAYDKGKEIGEAAGGKSLDFEMGRASALLDEEFKKYDPRQPRDDLGKWSSGGSGGISIGHALHVAKHEGIAAEHHAGIEEGIRSGKFATREAVLAHIDSIHGKQGTTPPSSAAQLSENYRQMGIANEAAEKEHGRHGSAQSDIPVAETMDDFDLEKLRADSKAGKLSDNDRISVWLNRMPPRPSLLGIAENIDGRRVEYAGDEKYPSILVDGVRPGIRITPEVRKFKEKTADRVEKIKSDIDKWDKIRRELHDKADLNSSRADYEFHNKSFCDFMFPAETPDAPETKHLTALESSLLAGVDFTSHSAAVLAAVEEFVERSHGLKTVRCERDGRRWSAEKYQSLTELASGLSEAADAIKAMAEAHAPKAVVAPDALKALAQIEITRARLNGVAL